jgi:hypothetical protein
LIKLHKVERSDETKSWSMPLVLRSRQVVEQLAVPWAVAVFEYSGVRVRCTFKFRSVNMISCDLKDKSCIKFSFFFFAFLSLQNLPEAGLFSAPTGRARGCGEMRVWVICGWRLANPMFRFLFAFTL